MADELSSEIILISETHLSSKIESFEISLEGWNEIRSDRRNRNSGGTLIYLKDSLVVSDQEVFSNEYVEMTLSFISKQNTIFVAVYRPPACPTEKFSEALLYLTNWIHKIEEDSKTTPVIVIGGDFNFPFLQAWTTEDIEDVSSNTSARLQSNSAIGSDRSQAANMIDFLNEFSLSQEVTEGTRGNNILDVIFTNDENLIDDIEVMENFQISDHKFIIANFNKSFAKVKEGRSKEDKSLLYFHPTL